MAKPRAKAGLQCALGYAGGMLMVQVYWSLFLRDQRKEFLSFGAGWAIFLTSCLLIGYGLSAFIDTSAEKGWRRGPLYNALNITVYFMIPLLVADSLARPFDAEPRTVALLSLPFLLLFGGPMLYQAAVASGETADPPSAS